MQTIVTHSGSFDPDDVLSVAAVSLFLGQGEFEVIRSRDKEVIEKADWVLDVGGIYDPATLRFDHHQHSVPTRENGVPFSAFGLVWMEIGEKICDSASIAKSIEKNLVFPIDAADNQIIVCSPSHPEISSFEFYDVINTYKPVWGSTEDFDVGFNRAVSFARTLLRRMIAQGQGDEIMHTLIRKTYEAADDKELLLFDHPIMRNELADYEGVKVYVSPVLGVDESNWMAVAVPRKNGSFHNRAIFPTQWGGLSDKALELVSGIEGAVFCHKELYIFVATTKEAALEAASQHITC
jgi:uncharacterized UPF0160 family protein